MPKYICPNCRGGFPAGPANDGCCPWCEQAIDGSYEPPETPVVSKTISDSQPSEGLLARLFR